MRRLSAHGVSAGHAGGKERKRLGGGKGPARGVPPHTRRERRAGYPLSQGVAAREKRRRMRPTRLLFTEVLAKGKGKCYDGYAHRLYSDTGNDQVFWSFQRKGDLRTVSERICVQRREPFCFGKLCVVVHRFGTKVRHLFGNGHPWLSSFTSSLLFVSSY